MKALNEAYRVLIFKVSQNLDTVKYFLLEKV